ncbi:membrane protein insertion efficiency factor YidD [Clostridium hydrogenum]|uniref:membrane protein insertion efficiency factor YidD n=1 Tax=Clostridium hydrogenum TaxID=2855764 RepID=UPI001F1E5DA1|nr:membrane protein insertion efficiency factor YidD [Clostridium hydrogenum]
MMKKILINLIKAYRKISNSPIARGMFSFLYVRGNHVCKYYPTCSQYAIDAIEKYGAIRGIIMALWRILRCNPFSKGGYDPVK